jgi:hypothetical protein
MGGQGGGDRKYRVKRFQELARKQRNSKILTYHNEAHSGILIAPLKRPRDELLQHKVNAWARMAEISMPPWLLKSWPQRFSNLTGQARCSDRSRRYF